MKQFQNTVTKVVRFGLRSPQKELSKNQKYNMIANRFLDNSEIKNDLDNKYKKRITESSNQQEWQNTSIKLGELIDSVFGLVKGIKWSLNEIDKLKNNSLHNKKIIFQEKAIAYSCGFGKNLFPNKNKRIDLFQFVDGADGVALENVKKYADDYAKCSDRFEAYQIFLGKQIAFIESSLLQVKVYTQSANHEKARLAEIDSKLQSILKTLHLLGRVYVNAVYFAGGVRGEVKAIQNKILDIKTEITKQIDALEQFSEKINDPKHGYEIGKATLHYRTINKRFIPQHNLHEIDRLLGSDSVRGGEFNNPLARFSEQILAKFKSRKRDNRLEIERGGSIIDKAKKVVELVREIDGMQDDDVTLWNICNALNNKRQTYDEFINRRIDFADLGWKQKLKFGLTVLVDCDVYRPKESIHRCCELQSEVEEYLRSINFAKYDEYKNFTYKIAKNNSPTKNAKDRGKLITEIHKSRDYILVNREIAQIRGALQAYEKYLKDAEKNINMIQYFAVLAKGEGDQDLILLIDREYAKSFYQKITSDTLPTGAEKLYLYDSLTEKALSKLFNQLESKAHPFRDCKRQLACKYGKEFNGLKLKDLKLQDLKNLFSADIAISEGWQDKFQKFYNKLNGFNDKKELLSELTRHAFLLKEKSVDLEYLQKEFSDLIVAQMNINTNQYKNSLHKGYFERAFKKMSKHKDVDVKINPELHIYCTPQRDEHIRQAKIEDIAQRKMRHKDSGHLIDTDAKAEEFCENEHRFWRNLVTIGIPIEIGTKKPPHANTEKVQVIGIDRGEKKIATLCILEKNQDGEFVVPIEYYDQNGNLRQTYFLDLAQFKVGRIDGEQKIIRLQTDDKNLALKKYEFITRLIKTIWIKDNRKKIQTIFSGFDESKIDDKDYVRDFIVGFCGSDKTLSNDKIGKKFFNNDGLGVYQQNILADDFVLDTIVQLITIFNQFDFGSSNEEQILQQKDMELGKIRLRDVVAANIAGIVDFIFRENHKNGIETYCALENLHNSSFRNFKMVDKISNKMIVNDDFVETTHNKLYQTGTYDKVEQAIMHKLQVHKMGERGYFNYSFTQKAKHQIKEMQFALKQHTKTAGQITDEWQGKVLKIKESKMIGNIIFVDPYYTSRRCPKCGVWGKEKKHNKKTGAENEKKAYIVDRNKEDLLVCNAGMGNGCGYESLECVVSKGHVLTDSAHTIISTGDENGAFFIGLRGVNTLTTKS